MIKILKKTLLKKRNKRFQRRFAVLDEVWKGELTLKSQFSFIFLGLKRKMCFFEKFLV